MCEDYIMLYPDYKNDVVNYNKFLIEKWKVPLEDDLIKTLLQGVRIEDILESLQSNVDKNVYKKKNSAKKYATVIGSLYHYIFENTDVENSSLSDAISYNNYREKSYMKVMMDYINNCDKLGGVIEQEVLDCESVKALLTWCDVSLSVLYNEDLNNGSVLSYEDSNIDYRKITAALAIKFIMFLGITYRELRKLRWNQYLERKDCIIINSYEIRLPMNLSAQLSDYKKYIKTIRAYNKSQYIFSDINSVQWGEKTSSSGIPDYLRALLDTASLNSIVKYGITQMIKVGISDSVIKNLTGASDKLIKWCLSDENVKNELNNKLVQVPMYYEF